MENGQNPNERIPFKDQTWKGTKSRTRDATLSRYTGVDVTSLNLITKVAESHSGELWRGKWQGNDIVARILAVPEVTPRISRDFQTEFPALRIFAHANICPVLAAANQPPNLVVISQFMPFGKSIMMCCMSKAVSDYHTVVIDHSQAVRFAVDIARGMSYLHSLDPPILRYYLSSKHVVVDEELTAKLSMADTKFSFQEVGRVYSPAWMSPEALQRDPEDLNIRAADMWSFGILLWELNTREVPFADLSPMECGMKIDSRNGFGEVTNSSRVIAREKYGPIDEYLLERGSRSTTEFRSNNPDSGKNVITRKNREKYCKYT
ncbi:hypothetical protein COOONC_20379 [Cooperia oncophora]